MRGILVFGTLLMGVGCGTAPDEPLPLGAGPGALCPTPDVVDVGRLEVGAEAVTNVTLMSCGESPVVIRGASADVDWIGVEVDRNTALAPGESTSISIRVQPTAVGLLSATVAVDHDSGRTVIPVRLEAEPSPIPVQISGFMPEASRGQEVGGELEIFGTGFDTPAWSPATQTLANEVTIDGHPVPLERFVLSRCSSERLVVTIPYAVDDGALGPDGREIPVRVANERGADVESYLVLPPLATRPDPIIGPQTAVPPGIEGTTGTSLLRNDLPANVNGANFSSVAEENRVTIEAYGEMIEISGVTVSAAGDRLTFTMPSELPIPAGNPTGGLLKVEVAGAVATATASCLLLLTP